MDLKGIYSSATQYAVGDVTKYSQDEQWYVLLRPCPIGTAPTNTLYWNRADATLAIAAEMALDAMNAAEEAAETKVYVISGDDPTLTCQANARYVCGEVDTISITPPESGICDVIFESGSTAAVLTLPDTVIMPDWFDADNLETNTIYEINIMDGVYGTVTTWATD